MDAMREHPEAPFAAYTHARLPDLHALHALAAEANLQFGQPGACVWTDGLMVYYVTRWVDRQASTWSIHPPTTRHTYISTQPNPIPGPEKTARFLAQILISLCKSLGLFAHTYEDLTFGVDSYPPRPYRDIVRMYVRGVCMCECIYTCRAITRTD